MTIFNKKTSILTFFLYSSFIHPGYAGPPFFTYDPQPVDFKHWEFYISSVNILHHDNWSGTSPHFELNYGLVRDLQVHLLLPVNYNYTPHLGADFGYGNTEFGVKYCFIHETENSPQVGTFPILDIPTIKNSEFSTGKTQIFLPVWAQKSWGKLTTYGGIGYCINPGVTNRNWIFTGAEVQYEFSPAFMPDGELYYHSADAESSKSITACSIGGSVNFS
ncbi:MAG: hypothetical protein NTY95_07910 [Bacteroidia bacterium]|nr:hypothetical protein [Bacteroidia bacterium]